MDFPIEDSEPLEARINAAIESLQPAGTKEIGIAHGPKERGGPIHCFIEFYGTEIETEDIEVISEQMRLKGEVLNSSLETGSAVSE